MATNITTQQVLTRARDIITPPEKWTKGEFARDADGHGVFSEAGAAVCWCSLGAVTRAVTDLAEGAEVSELVDVSATDILNEAASRLDGGRLFDGSVARFNDRAETTHADVMKLFDLAIELAKQEEFE